MSKRVEKIAVVTGGTGALGRVVVQRLLTDGVTVIATQREKSVADPFIGQLLAAYPAFSLETADVSVEDSVADLYGRILAKHQGIDILCNLVGGIRKKKVIEDVTLEEWDEMLRVNLTSGFLMTRGAIRLMKAQRWGRIINMAAMPAITPEPLRGGYGVAKSGVVTLTKTVSAEVQTFSDITVNAIAPSTILTEENKQWGTAEEIQQWVTPEQIAEMIVYLCSDAGKAVNGQIIQMYGKV